jgi:hypothetical protein
LLLLLLLLLFGPGNVQNCCKACCLLALRSVT